MSYEAKRKEDMEERRKRILDRMQNKGAGVLNICTICKEQLQQGGGADDNALAQTAQLKAQKVDRIYFY